MEITERKAGRVEAMAVSQRHPEHWASIGQPGHLRNPQAAFNPQTEPRSNPKLCLPESFPWIRGINSKRQ